MRQKFITLFAVILSSLIITAELFAIPAYPYLISYKQPNGQTVKIILQGDEYVHWAVTEDGYTLLQNKAGGYEYAKPGFNGKLNFSGILASDIQDRNAAEINFINGIEQNLSFTKEQIAEMKEMNPVKPKIGTKVTFPTTGTRKMLVILANFTNTTTSYTQANFNDFMNLSNYGSKGSFKDYYYENSYGQLTINSTVTVWVKVPNTHDYYGPEDKWAEFVRDAVNAADASGVDFSQFDNNGDGKVDGIAVIHQGVGQEESGNVNDIWSHNWCLSYGGFNVSKDGKTIDEYTVQPEKSGTAMATIGTICHEVGHNLGAPDYYDTDYSTNGQYNGTGNWDVMCSGASNGSPYGSRPAHHNPYTKIQYGWVTPTTISSAANVTLTNSEQNKVIYKYTTTTSNEYFLLENRQQLGFDTNLPGKGMLVWHVDGTWITNHMNANDINATSHQGLHIEIAYSSINSSSCPFPGASSKTTFTDTTTPNSKSWALANTNKPITSITQNTTDKTVSFKFMGGTTTTTPTATTNAATSIGTTTALLNGSVNANNTTCIVSFEYGTTTSYGSTISATPSSVTGTTATSVSASLSGLTANTLYHYRVKIVAGTTTAYGSDATFTTSATVTVSAPTVTSTAASNVATTSATINGTVKANNATTTVSFEWGTTTSYGSTATATPSSVTGTTVNNVSANLTGLIANKTYYYRVKAVNSAGTTYGTGLSFTTPAATATYCTANGTTISYEWIDYVSMGTITNTTTASTGGYGNYTSKTASIKPGNTYTITFSAGFSSSVYTEYWRIFIDYNRDGDFVDTGEKVVSGSTTGSGNYQLSFTVPTTASLGTTRMRVLMSDNSATTSPCGSFTYGEVEDYTINISSTAAAPMFAESINQIEVKEAETMEFESTDITIYPNPSSEKIEISASFNPEQLIVSIYNISGKLVKEEMISNESEINIANVESGIYTIKIFDGQKLKYSKFIKQ